MHFPATRLYSATKRNVFNFLSVKRFDRSLFEVLKSNMSTQSQHFVFGLVSVRTRNVKSGERRNQNGLRQLPEASGGCAADQGGDAEPRERICAAAPRTLDHAE